MTKVPTCGCGRSPTGNCIGWHALSETEYQEKRHPTTRIQKPASGQNNGTKNGKILPVCNACWTGTHRLDLYYVWHE